jgi:hypothetical protein
MRLLSDRCQAEFWGREENLAPFIGTAGSRDHNCGQAVALAVDQNFRVKSLTEKAVERKSHAVMAWPTWIPARLI